MSFLAIGLITASPVLAAEVLDEIQVTAQKREQGVNDVGITVNAFTGDELRELGLFSAEQMAQFTPGLTVNDTAATGVPLYTIRGVGFQDYSTAASSTVGLYFDEVAIPYTVMSRGVVFDVQRVEVLKGPQGDLYGRNTTAGQINFVSNKPTEEFEAGFHGSYGRFGIFDLEGFASGALGDKVQARLAFRTTQSSKGWQQSTTRDDTLGELDSNAVRALFNFEASDTVNILLNLHYVIDKSDNRANTPYDGTLIGLGEFAAPYTPLDKYLLPTGAHFGETPPWYSTGDNRDADWTNSYTSPITGRTFDVRPQRNNELKGVSAKLEWNLGNMDLTSITGYDKFDRTEANDWDGGFYNDSSNINTTDLEVFSEELRLTGQSDDLLWIGGLYYSHDEMDEYYHYFMSDSVYGLGSIPWGAFPFVLAPILELDTKYQQTTESKAVFGHVEWSFADSWRLTLGARYTEEDRKWAGCTFAADDGSLSTFLNTLFGSTLDPGDCGTIDDDPASPTYIFAVIGGPNVNDAFHVFEDTIKTNKWMGKIGLDYIVSEDILLFATLSEGFKSGGFNGANSNTTQQLKPYREEELTSLELGVKATLLEGRMQLNAAGFYYDYKDKQEQDIAVTFVGNISGVTNVPKSEIMGAELAMNWIPFDGLTVNLGLAYLDTEVKEWDAVDPDASSWPVTVYHDVSGIELAMAPRWQAFGLVSYEWPIGSDLVMEVAGDFSYQDSTTGGVQAADATASYTLYNARISIGSADYKWRAQLFGRNLTDEYYYPAAYQGGNGPYIRAAGMPITYGIAVTYNF
ncbi:MAG TPA: TonB-dependent receptor [Xanthomonadales bacterium]|nr:TonB-dependent receptor [Xanthomonadales bacterium]